MKPSLTVVVIVATACGALHPDNHLRNCERRNPDANWA